MSQLQQINPRYQFLEPLSAGSFGSTFLMNDTITNSKCIIKFVKLDDFHENEIEIMKKINSNGCHPNLICLRDYFVYETHVAIISDYINGDTLLNFLIKQDNITQVYTKRKFFIYNEFLWVFKKLLDSLNYMHNVLNVPHLDLKPGNIMISDEKNAYNVAIIDLGSTCITSNNVCVPISWTRQYIPPSYIDITNTKSMFNLDYGKSVDVFSLGMTMFHLLFMMDIYSNMQFTRANAEIRINETLKELEIQDNPTVIARFRKIYNHIEEDDAKKIIRMFSGILIQMLNPNDSARPKVIDLLNMVNEAIKTHPIIYNEIVRYDTNVKENMTKLNQVIYMNRNKTKNGIAGVKYTQDRIKQLITEDYIDVLQKSNI